MNPKTLARAGLASAPVTVFAPAVGVALTGTGVPWLLLPLGSVAAAVAGTRAGRREASIRRGVVVDDPDLNEIREMTAPRDLVTVEVEYAWSDEAA